MEKNVWEKLQTVLARVDKTVDQRFEKDAELYISQPEIEKIKHKMYQGEYGMIVGMIKAGYVPEIITKVVIENAWLLPNNRYKLLLDIIKQCQPIYLNKMTGILMEKYDLPKSFRDELIGIYLDKVDSRTAEALIKAESEGKGLLFLHNPKLRVRCLGAALCQLSPLEKYQRFKNYVEGREEIYTSPQWETLDSIFKEEFLQKVVLDAIFQDNFMQENTPGYKYWYHVFTDRCKLTEMLVRAGMALSTNGQNYSLCTNLWNRIVPSIRDDQALQEILPFIRQAAPNWSAKLSQNLSRKIVQRLGKVKPEWRNQVIQVFQSVGIQVQDQDDDLPDLDGISRELQLFDIIREGKYRYLAVSFHKRYKKQVRENLELLYSKMDDESHFEEFCFVLTEKYPFYPPYLIYVIEEFVDKDGDKDCLVVERLLDHIKVNNLLRSKKLHQNEKEQIVNFVKEKDFELFVQLTN